MRKEANWKIVGISDESTGAFPSVIDCNKSKELPADLNKGSAVKAACYRDPERAWMGELTIADRPVCLINLPGSNLRQAAELLKDYYLLPAAVCDQLQENQAMIPAPWRHGQSILFLGTKFLYGGYAGVRYQFLFFRGRKLIVSDVSSYEDHKTLSADEYIAAIRIKP